MHHVIQGWHTTINPNYFVLGAVLYSLGFVLLLFLLSVKVSGRDKEKHLRLMSIGNLTFCILCACELLMRFFEIILSWYSGYLFDQLSFFNRTIGNYWLGYLVLMWLPLLLTQLFWKKRNREHINLSLVILFLFNLGWIIDVLLATFNALIKH